MRARRRSLFYSAAALPQAHGLCTRTVIFQHIHLQSKISSLTPPVVVGFPSRLPFHFLISVVLGVCCSSFPVCPARPEHPWAQSVSVQAQDVSPCPRGPCRLAMLARGCALPLLAAASAGTAPALPCPAQSSRAPKGSSPHSTSCLLLSPPLTSLQHPLHAASAGKCFPLPSS